jgi:hypothetical protein
VRLIRVPSSRPGGLSSICPPSKPASSQQPLCFVLNRSAESQLFNNTNNTTMSNILSPSPCKPSATNQNNNKAVVDEAAKTEARPTTTAITTATAIMVSPSTTNGYEIIGADDLPRVVWRTLYCFAGSRARHVARNRSVRTDQHTGPEPIAVPAAAGVFV